MGDIISINKSKLVKSSKAVRIINNLPMREACEAVDSIYISEINKLLDSSRSCELYDKLDMELVNKVRDELVDGNYHIPAEKVAKAIVEETMWVENWLV